MTVRFKCWSEDGEEVINIPKSQLISEFAPQAAGDAETQRLVASCGHICPN